MKTVQFPEVYEGGVIKYPDDPALFSNIDVLSEGVLIADYAGQLDLDEAERPYLGSWVIEVPAYLRRFDWCCTTPKQAALACDDDSVCRGMMSLALSRVREGIDLQSASLPGFLAALVAKGKITQAEATKIRTTPPRADELFKA